MYREIDIVSFRFDEKALFFTADLSSLFFCVLLSYYNPIRCYQRIKTLLHCLIQATYYYATTHRGYTYSRNLTKENTMRHRYNIQSVQVVMSDIRIIAKAIKYVMLATMTFCLVYIALWFQHYEAMVV